jgi:hypothetical protein
MSIGVHVNGGMCHVTEELRSGLPDDAAYPLVYPLHLPSPHIRLSHYERTPSLRHRRLHDNVVTTPPIEGTDRDLWRLKEGGRTRGEGDNMTPRCQRREGSRSRSTRGW